MGKRISQLNALSSASLNTTLVGIDNGVTYKITLDVLEDAVINMLSASTDARLDFLETFSSSFNSFSASLDNRLDNVTIDTSSLATKTSFNTFTQSYQTDSASFDSRISSHISGTNYISESYGEFVSSYHAESSSFSSRIEAATNEQFIAGLLLTASFNTYTASINLLSSSLDNRLDTLESFSSSADNRYVLSGSITQTTWDNISGKPTGLVSQSTDLTSLNSFTQSIDGRVDTLENLTSSFATTGSNHFSGSQYISGSILFENGAQIEAPLGANGDIRLFSSQSDGYLYVTDINTGIFYNSYYVGVQSNGIEFEGNIITNNNFIGNQTITGSIHISGGIEFTDQSVQTTAFTGIPNGTISGSQQISQLGFITGSYLTSSTYTTFSTSVDSRLDTLEAINMVAYLTTASYTTESASFNSRLASEEFKSTTFANTSSVNTISASAWGAFQSASSYSSSLATAISASDAEYTSFSASSATWDILQDTKIGNLNTISASYLTFTQSYYTDSASFTTRINSGGGSVPAGTVSGSSQITLSSTTGYSTFSSSLATTDSASAASVTALSASIATRDINQDTTTTTISTSVASRLTTEEFKSTTFATTGSNNFNGNQVITGSLTVTTTTVISSSINAASSSLYLNSGSNLYVQNNGIVEITGSVTLSGSMNIQSGSITMPNRPAFRVIGNSSTERATGLTLSGSAVSVDYNEGGYFNTTNGTFTAPIAGLYHVYYNGRVGGTNAAMQVIVYKNAGVALMWETAGNTGATHFGVSGIVKMAVNDTLKATVTVGSIQFDGNDNFGAAYIG